MKKVVGEGISRRIFTQRPSKDVQRVISNSRPLKEWLLPAGCTLQFPAKIVRAIWRRGQMLIFTEDGKPWKVIYGKHGMHRKRVTWTPDLLATVRRMDDLKEKAKREEF